MIELRGYQQIAVDNLKSKINRVLGEEGGIVVFQAPTGSGKTLMVAETLRELVTNRNDGKKLSFIWISVRMLHEQSKEKLEKYYEDSRNLTCSYFGDLQDNLIGENEILFVNWHSINKKEINIYVRENEQDNNLNAIIQHTRREGREIILIIDESHHSADTEKSRELINIISPKVTLEVSATPHFKEGVTEIEKVPLGKVKDEEMIRSEVSVNPEFLTLQINNKSTNELVIEQALEKRQKNQERDG